MQKPKIYIHRAGTWYPLFMNGENEALLRLFAEVVSDGGRENPMGPDELVERMDGCSGILSLNGFGAGEITLDVLKRVGTIKVVSIAHWWGPYWDAARDAGIAVVEGSNGNTIAVAEWTVAAALMGVRNINMFDRRLKSGSSWAEPRYDAGLLCGSTVGLVGLGRIGWYAAHYFKMLGAKVIAFDKDRKKTGELGIPLIPLDELLKTADVISLHLPVTPETTGLLGAREFSLIKDGAVFINSARAALYDEPALIQELKKNRFSAFLDVFSTEPIPHDHPFRTIENVTITPHIAGNNMAMLVRCGREAIQTLKNYFEGKELRDLQYWYPYFLKEEAAPCRN